MNITLDSFLFLIALTDLGRAKLYAVPFFTFILFFLTVVPLPSLSRLSSSLPFSL